MRLQRRLYVSLFKKNFLYSWRPATVHNFTPYATLYLILYTPSELLFLYFVEFTVKTVLKYFITIVCKSFFSYLNNLLNYRPENSGHFLCFLYIVCNFGHYVVWTFFNIGHLKSWVFCYWTFCFSVFFIHSAPAIQNFDSSRNFLNPTLRPYLRPNTDDSLFHVIDSCKIFGSTQGVRPNENKTQHWLVLVENKAQCWI